MNIECVLSSLAGVLIGTFLTFLFNVKAKDKEIKKLFEVQQSMQAAKIAELLAFWNIAEPYTNDEHRSKLNNYSFELSLILPTEIYEELSRVLRGAEDKKDPKEVLIMLRKLYKGKDDTLRAESIIHWEKLEIVK